MRHSHGVWIAGLLAAALGAAALGVHASSAAPARATAGATTTTATYSCRVRRQHYINISASVTLPPVDNRPQPGVLVLTTGVKTIHQNGVLITPSQLGFRARRNSLKIDKSACTRVNKQIPLKPKGLPGPPTIVTPHHQGFDNEQCGTTAKVLVRLRLTTTNQIPSHALFAVRDEGTRSRPVAFYNWSPTKLSVYTAYSCTSQ